jgi:(2Fe-2S) ferredoxin
MGKAKLFVCTKGKSCRKRGAKKVFCALKQEIKLVGLSGECKLKKSDCLGGCGSGPTVRIKPGKLWFQEVLPADCRDIIGTLSTLIAGSRFKD